MNGRNQGKKIDAVSTTKYINSETISPNISPIMLYHLYPIIPWMVEFITCTQKTRHHFHHLLKQYFDWLTSELKSRYDIEYIPLDENYHDNLETHVTKTVDEYLEMKSEDGAVYLLKVNSDFVGMGIIQRLTETKGEIKRMFVEPSQRGKRYGQMIFDFLLAQAKKMNFERLVLDSAKFMTAAHKLYEKNGFKYRDPYPESEVPAEMQDSAVFMEKVLIEY